jgi:hypothetical protein
LNTELNRADAKGAILTRETGDPELAETLSSGHKFQLELVKEQNRHAEKMRGLGARIFGHGDNAPTYIAAAAVAAGVFIAGGCLIAAFKSNDQQMIEFWSKQAERSFAFSATALAFIFGKGLSKN